MTQDEALAILKTGANVFLTGEPGSGKTHTVNCYVSYLREQDVATAVTASTGIAATHLNGITIHSWSGIGVRDTLTQDDLDRIANNKYIAKRIEKTKALIIDEISMLDGKIFSLVDTVCREVRRSSQPFGGLQVVCVGDFFQLPPVSRQGENTQFAFQSDVWKAMKPVVCYLTGQYRQDDALFVSLLSAIRSNTLNIEYIRHINARIKLQHDVPKNISRLFTHNVDVDRMNNESLALLPGKPAIFLMSSQGKETFVAGLKKSCLSPESLKLKEGATVMFTKNNPHNGFVNGTLGTVEGFSEENGYPIVRTRNGSLIEAAPMDWTVEENEKVKAKITQIPLRLAWAITVHKSQGMSLDAAVIDLRGTFEFGQGYVALSRLRRFSGLYLLGYNAQTFRVHPAILAEDMLFRVQSDETIATLKALAQNDLEQKYESFLVTCDGNKTALKKNKKTEVVSQPPDTAEPKPQSWMEKVRAKYPNAYRSWQEQDDALLRELFEKGASIGEIAEKFGRQRGGIRSRLVKIGVLNDNER